MPTYEYECAACGHRFEKFQLMTDRVLRKCPECGKSKLQKLIGSGAGIIFKGSGFYQTDYRSGDYQSAAKKETDSSAPAADKAETTEVAEKPKKTKAAKKADKQ